MNRQSKRCLLINNSPQPGRKDLAKLGGGGKSLLGLLSQLPALGWQPHVVVPGEGQFTSALVDLGISHSIFPFTPLSSRHPIDAATQTIQWLRIIRQTRPAVIHANGFDLSRSFSMAARLAGIPYITHVRFPVEAEGARWTLKGLPKPAAFIFNSHAMKEKLWPMLHDLAPSSTGYVVHNAVDLSDFSPAPWPEGPVLRIGMVANFAPFKRHETFLRMAAEILKARNDLEFWIVGEDTQGSGRRQILEQLARDLEISQSVKFLGHRLDIPQILRQLHLLVVPSKFEPFGRVIIEAMACGRPVIGSNDGGIPEIIEPGITGFLEPVDDYQSFANAALAVIGSREMWENMSQAAAKKVCEKFSLVAHAESIDKIYRNVSNTIG